MDTVAVEVRIPLTLRRLTDGAATVKASGLTVAQVIEDLGQRHAGLRERILDADGKLYRFMNIYRNGEDIRYQAQLETRLSEGDQIQIVPAAAGG